MKATLFAISIALPSLVVSSNAQQQKEVAFSIQGSALTWFEIGNPTVQGMLSVTGLPNGFDGNGLAYDAGSNRLLFVGGPSAVNHNMFSVSLEDVMLKAGESVDAGGATNVGVLTFSGAQELFGGGFYDGSYYTLINGTDKLVKVDFDSLGNILQRSNIDLFPTNNVEMYLGDLAFDSDGSLIISGAIDQNVNASNDRLWRFSTTDGVSFVNEGALSPAGVRYNGIFFGLEDDLYGYRKAGVTPAEYGSIDEANGAISQIYVGEPFESGGDLSNGILINVVPEPSGALLAALGGSIGLMRRRRRH